MQAAPTSNAPAWSAPSAWATSGAVFGVSSSWRHRRHEHEIDVAGVDAGARSACAPAAAAKSDSRSSGAATPALADPGARHDPILGDAEPLGQLRRRQAPSAELAATDSIAASRPGRASSGGRT